ncbi:uncharacterized protein LOC129941109 [Eupeodes corollae]|uniref:uncharacterized protein LOC129941109 n=1 Tax=Eupeodes corollae TaxID=290404 RepID=UPI00249217A6|nr:uncharacterized protein LOC129941109 [Eupeodes corollae]
MLFKDQKIGDLVVFEESLIEWRLGLSLFVDEEGSECTSLKRNLSSLSPITPSSSRGPVSPEPIEVSIHLADILNDCKKSSIVTQYYERHSKLLGEHRSILISIICCYFQENSLHMSIKTSYRLENEILNRFPGEKLEYYRVGRRGKIYAKACNDKRSYRTLLKRTLPLDTDASDSTDVEPLNPRNKQFSPETDAEECIRSLKYDNLSVTEFDSCWQACSQYRMQNVQQASSLDDIFAKWPEYKTPTGFRLIDKDFATIYGSRPGILARWPEQASSLMNFLFKQTQSRDKKMRTMLESINQEDVNSDATAVKLLWCLHFFLFPTQKSVKKDNCGKKSVVKFTVSSSQQAFLFMGKSIQEIEDHISFLKSKGESIQPFMLGIGDSDLENILNFYVYVDGVKFLFNCFLRAVDICFKTYHLFNLEYPPACTQFWAFIENHFYDMKITKHISSKMFVLSNQLKSPSS